LPIFARLAETADQELSYGFFSRQDDIPKKAGFSSSAFVWPQL